MSSEPSLDTGPDLAANDLAGKATGEELPSWQQGPALDAVIAFLDSAEEIAPDARLAVFDNDGTLWVERPHYVQFDFYAWWLQRAIKERPELNDVVAYRAVAAGDEADIGSLGLEHVSNELNELFSGIEPAVFEEAVRSFFDHARHPHSKMRYDRMVYKPMIELMAALARRGFDNCIVTGSGTEFVRAISQSTYGIGPERVVGTLIAYEYDDSDDANPRVRRRTELFGDANEGQAKALNIQQALGRRPVFAAGNTPGDREMLSYTNAGPGPTLALLINHDDAVREYEYVGSAASFASAESMHQVAEREGWTQVSMSNDWAVVVDPDS